MKMMNSPAALSPSVSNRHRWVVLGNPDNRRTTLFQSALQEAGLPAAHVISYRDVLRGKLDLSEELAQFAGNGVLRIESPGEDHDVERRLIALGARGKRGQTLSGQTISTSHRLVSKGSDPFYHGVPSASVGEISPESALRLREDRGRVRHVRQWYAGFSSLLDDVEQALQTIPGIMVQNHPAAIRLLFDKPGCHQFLAASGVSVAPSLPPIHSYEELREAMKSAGWSRVFVKLAWGSSSSGVVAFSTVGGRPLAITSLELVRRRGEARFYNNLTLSRYHNESDLRAIFDFLGREGVHVEQWLPKATQGGRNYDLRVVTFAGKACHTVVRTSLSPLTNLHLGNRRGDLSLVRQAAGERWSIVTDLCEQAAKALPGALYVGWDVLVTPGFRRAVILEGNAFGDLLPNVVHEGFSTYGRGIVEVTQTQSH